MKSFAEIQNDVNERMRRENERYVAVFTKAADAVFASLDENELEKFCEYIENDIFVNRLNELKSKGTT